jgi:serine/threonine protein kinase
LQDIVHRDLKPANILVHIREPAKFCVKIADFGLAMDESILKTFCGTRLYCAPEIWKHCSYTTKVDIWSLGVVAFQYAYRLLEYPKSEVAHGTTRWYEAIVRSVDDWDLDPLVDLLSSYMLKMNPDERQPATQCLQEATRVLDRVSPVRDSNIDPGTPTEAMSSSMIIRGLQDHVRQEIAADLASFPSLPTITQVRVSRPADQYAFEIDGISQQSPGTRFASNSLSEPSKRQRLEEANKEGHHNLKQKSWAQWQEQHLTVNTSLGYIQMTVKKRAISMRSSDYWLSATALMGLAGSTEAQKARIRKQLTKHTTVEVLGNGPRRQMWVPFTDGQFLCEHLNLVEKVSPLL